MKLISNNKKPDKLDKIRAYYLEGKELTPQQEDMRQKYLAANAFLISNPSVTQCANYMTETFRLSSPQAYAIMREAKVLFGEINKADKEGEKYIFYENFMRLYEKCMSDGDYKTAEKALAQAGKIRGVFDEEQNKIPYDKIMLQPIIISDNPQVLKDEQTIDITPEDDE